MTAPSTVPIIAELHAPVTWGTVDFISDLHLQASERTTWHAWCRYLRSTPADALFILGDLFEVWIGDDAVEVGSFDASCRDALWSASRRMPIYFMHGNRDFLLGKVFLGQTGMAALRDPTVLVWGSQRLLLSHGDALCAGDVDYLRFRDQVRDSAWQQAFLARPVKERRAFARNVRGESEARKTAGDAYADVDAAQARAWLQAANANILVHGHTHRPAVHMLQAPHPSGNFGATTGASGHDQEIAGLQRIVLSDWDADASPPRLEVLRFTLDGAWQRLSLPPT